MRSLWQAKPFTSRLHRQTKPLTSGSGAARTKAVQRGEVSSRLLVPSHITCPPYAKSGVVQNRHPRLAIHDSVGVSKLRKACQLAKDTLDHAGSLVKPGVTTDAIDKAVHNFVISKGAYPSPLNYSSFPKSLCASVNEVICHGIPDNRPLQEGDIVNLDVSVFLEGFHGDTSRTFCVGGVDQAGHKLVQITKQSLHDAIKLCGPNVKFSEIGKLISGRCIASGFTSVKEFCGHGIGEEFHMLPYIYHYENNYPGLMLPGMAFTIEPMLCEGSAENYTLDDGWTVVTRDHKRSAQFEHTILITDHGCEILT